ncbi:MAG: class I SAM-dependent methyltransferase [Saprospiraceae bacterium]
MLKTFVEKYDQMILSKEMREMYNGTNFYNVGYWQENTDSLDRACEQMVINHLEKINLPDLPLAILDVGCGLGNTTAQIAEKYPAAYTIGINISPAQIEYAKDNYTNIQFEAMDAADLIYPKNCFDLIISVEAVFHFDTRMNFLHHAHRVLKPGGQLIFSDLLLNDTTWVGDWSIPAANMFPDLGSYKKMLKKTGFIIEEVQNITHDSWLGFCRHLRKIPGMETLANGLEKSVIAYLLVSLRK